MSNTEQFLELYNDIDSLLREKYHDTVRTNSVIVRFVNELNKTHNPELEKIAKKLNTIRILRNNIVHDYDNNSDHLFEINDEVIVFLKKVLEMLRNPKNARDLCTPLKNLYIIKEDEDRPVYIIMEEMRKLGHSQAPVLGKHNVVKGIFSPNVLFSYFVKNHDANFKEILFSDLKEFLLISNHFSETYEFINSGMNEREVDNLFMNRYQHNKKLAVAFVTQNGNPKEPLIGIIVPGDILKN